MDNPVGTPTIVDAQEGQTLSVVGDTYRIIITGEQTGGAYAAIDMLIPPGGGPGPHSHADIQESFYVLEGEVVVKSVGRSYTARKGAFVNIPLGGMVHDFKNETDTVARLQCVVVPSGLEKFFQEIGKPAAAGEFLPPPPPPDPQEQQRMTDIAAKYGQKVYPPDYLDK